MMAMGYVDGRPERLPHTMAKHRGSCQWSGPACTQGPALRLPARTHQWSLVWRPGPPGSSGSTTTAQALGPFEPPTHPRLLTLVRIAQAD